VNPNLYVWDLQNNFKLEKTIKIKGGRIIQGKISEEGLYLGLGTADGQCKILNLRYFDFESEQTCHKGKVMDLSFTNDSRFMLTVS
jgi:WD40 repeat protein